MLRVNRDVAKEIAALLGWLLVGSLVVSAVVSLLYRLLLFSPPTDVLELLASSAPLFAVLLVGGAIAAVVTTIVFARRRQHPAGRRERARSIVRAGTAGPAAAAIPGGIIFVGTMGWYGVPIVAALLGASFLWSVIVLALLHPFPSAVRSRQS